VEEKTKVDWLTQVNL